MSKSRKAILTLSWHSVAYGIGTIGSQLVVYLVLPILTRSMTKEEYGAIPVLMALFTFLNMLTNAGLPAATYHYYNNTETPQEKRILLGGSQFLFFIFAAIPAIPMLIFAEPLALLLLNSAKFAPALQLLAIYLVVDTMNFFGNVILRIQVRPLVSSLHSIMMIGIKMGLAVLFVAGYNMGVTGYWLGYAAGSILSLGVMIWLVRKDITFQFSWKQAVELTRFGFPLIPAALSMMVLRLSDRYIIGALAGLGEVAVYDIGYKAGSLIMILISPFRSAWVPYAYSIAQKPEAPKIFKDVLAYVVAGSALLALGATVFSREIVAILAPASYEGAVSVVGWVAASHLFIAAHPILSTSLVTQRKGPHLAWIAVAGGAVNMALNFLLIPSIGILGAAIATFAGYGTLSILSYVIGKRWFDMQINWLRMGRIALAALPIVAGNSLIESASFTVWVGAALKTLLLLTFPLLLLAVRFVTMAQVKEMIDLAKNIMSRRKGVQPAEGDTV